jgi:hypothetical protein
MLANALFLTDTGEAARKFRNTEVYLDTPFLVDALGYSGKPRQTPCKELLELLYEAGAELRCFAHTLEEVRGILYSASSRLASGDLHARPGSCLEYFVSAGFEPSDVELLIVRLEADIEKLRIRVKSTPHYEERIHVIDHAGLRDKLRSDVGYVIEETLSRDVESIAAIFRLRRGHQTVKLEHCTAVLVTTNYPLVRAVRDYFSEALPPSTVLPCVGDHTLTNILWLKKPQSAPALPLHRLIADCYATIQPDPRLWNRFLGEIEKLERESGIAPDDYYFLRYSIEAKAELMELTLGVESAFTQGTVKEILDRYQTRMKQEAEDSMQARIDTLREQLGEAEGQAIQAAREREARQTYMEQVAQKYARWITRVLQGLLIAALVVISFIAFFFDVSTYIQSSISIIGILLIVYFIFSLCGSIFGTTIKSACRTVELRLYRSILRVLIRVSEPDAAMSSH